MNVTGKKEGTSDATCDVISVYLTLRSFLFHTFDNHITHTDVITANAPHENIHLIYIIYTYI